MNEDLAISRKIMQHLLPFFRPPPKSVLHCTSVFSIGGAHGCNDLQNEWNIDFLFQYFSNKHNVSTLDKLQKSLHNYYSRH